MQLQAITNLGIQEDLASQLLELFNTSLDEELSKKQLQMEDDYKLQLENVKLDSLIDQQLINAGAKNLKAVKALIDLSKLQKVDKDTINQLIEQLKNSQDTSFLFHSKQTGEKFLGFKPFENINHSTSKNTTYEELCSYYDTTYNL